VGCYLPKYKQLNPSKRDHNTYCSPTQCSKQYVVRAKSENPRGLSENARVRSVRPIGILIDRELCVWWSTSTCIAKRAFATVRLLGKRCFSDVCGFRKSQNLAALSEDDGTLPLGLGIR
jgi:hypothetical protein